MGEPCRRERAWPGDLLGVKGAGRGAEGEYEGEYEGPWKLKRRANGDCEDSVYEERDSEERARVWVERGVGLGRVCSLLW